MKPVRLTRLEALGLAAYYLTLTLTLGASFGSDNFYWGFALWKFLPPVFVWIIVVVAVGAPLVSLTAPQEGRILAESQVNKRKQFIVWGALLVTAIAVFWVFRVRVHLLGDGYTLLDFLSDPGPHPFFKNREIGEGLLHIWMRSFLMSAWGLPVKEAALLSFQILSVGSGVITVAVTWLLSGRLFSNWRDRALFSAGALSGGYALLFFGYVENYSVFLASTLAFTLVGLVALRQRRALVIAVALVGLSVWLHILGVTLTLALGYALIAGSPLIKRAARFNRAIIISAGLVVIVATGIVFWRLYESNLFFRLAFLPLTTTRFDVSGYTLFSGAHFRDLLNLFFVLCPWLAISGLALFHREARQHLAAMWQTPEVRFLMILSGSVLLSVLTLDPKLGLGRDWDLFAFVAVPLTTLFFYVTLKKPSGNLDGKLKGARRFLFLAISLNVVTLSARVFVLRDESSSVRFYKSLVAGDTRHLQSSVQNLQDYYFAKGDSASAIAYANQYVASFPEVALVQISLKLSAKRSFREAIKLCRRALSLNPQYAAAYANIGFNFVALEEYDSALVYLEVANGLNPYHWTTQEALGVARFKKGDRQGSSKILRSLLERGDSLSVKALSVLMRIAADEDNMQDYNSLLKRMVQRPDAPAITLIQIGDYYTSRSEFGLAYDAYSRAVELGADSSALRQFVRQHGTPTR